MNLHCKRQTAVTQVTDQAHLTSFIISYQYNFIHDIFVYLKVTCMQPNSKLSSNAYVLTTTKVIIFKWVEISFFLNTHC